MRLTTEESFTLSMMALASILVTDRTGNWTINKPSAMKKKQFQAIVIIFVISLFRISAVSNENVTEILTFTPSDDATLSLIKPNINFNTTILEADNFSQKHILFKFHVNGLHRRKVVKAVLQLHSRDSSDIGGTIFNAEHNHWVEDTVTWDSAPSRTGNVISTVGNVNVGKFYSWDVTSLIQTDGTYSLRIESPSSNGADYSSKENTNPPQLFLTLSGSEPTGNAPPTVRGPSNQIINLPQKAYLKGTVTDDGLPRAPGITTVEWSRISGPTTATIVQPNQAQTSISFQDAGSYVFRLTAHDGKLGASDDLTIVVSEEESSSNTTSVVDAGSDVSLFFNNSLDLNGTVHDDGLPNGPLTHQWSTVSGPGTVSFSDGSSLGPLVNFSAVGSYVLRLSSFDGALTHSDDIKIMVQPDPTEHSNLTFPIRAAFYYPWFPQTWTVNGAHVFYHPSSGYYDSGDQEIVDSHIASLDFAKVDVGIISWWGPTAQQETEHVPLLLNRTNALGSDLKWGIYYEKEGLGNPSVAELKTDLAYLQTRYTDSQAYAHVNDRPVLFVYNADDLDCSIVEKWLQATAGNWYLVLKVFPNYQSCANQPDSWHQYTPAVAVDHQTGYSMSISPGFWRADESTARLERDLSLWNKNIQELVSSKEDWQLITTFNAWGEGTAIEEATEWSTDYLEALSRDGLGGHGNPLVTMDLSPMSANLKIPASRSFTVTVEGTTNTNVSWSTSGGTINGSGHTITYTPPGQVGTYTLTATSAADSSKHVTASIDVSTSTSGGMATFAAAGDFGGKDARAGTIMNDMKYRDIDAFLLLGDMAYSEIVPESAWCDWVHSYLGSNYPFEIVAGNHEEDSRVDGFIRQFAACMPDQMNSHLGPGGYSVNFSFDLGPLTVIATSPDLIVDNVDYTYRSGSAERNWLVNTIRTAKSEGDWVAVGMHKNCITIGNKWCEIGQNFAQLLIDEGVDIVLQGHDHDYQRSHSLAIVQPGTFPSGAVVDDGSDNEYFRRAGTVFVIVGTVGKSLTTCSHSDSEYQYFAVHLCREEGNSKGYLLINATDTRMDMEFISVDGTFQDTFSIHE